MRGDDGGQAPDPAAVARERHDCEREAASLLGGLERLRAASVELVAGLPEAA